jgi:hypothetical protein
MARRQKSDSAPITLFSFQDIITTLSGIMIFLTLLLAVEVASRRESEAQAPETPINNIEAKLAELRNRVTVLRLESERKATQVVTEDPRHALTRADEIIRSKKQLNDLIRDQDALRKETARQEQTLQTLREQSKITTTEQADLENKISQLNAALAKAVEDRGIAFIPEAGTSKTPLLIECSSNSIRAGFITRPQTPMTFAATEDGRRQFLEFAGTRSSSEEYFLFLLKPSSRSEGLGMAVALRKKGYDVGYDALEEDKTVKFKTVP